MEPNAGSKQIQKRMGPAPFASFEDLSDEMESPDDKDPLRSIIRLPGITEQDATSPIEPKSRIHSMGISLIGSSRSAHSSSQSSISHSPLLNKIKPNTPRIDISRASSSSHHDSRDSTPEREICDIEENNVKLGLGFKEDGALELRLSTEELDFQETCENKKSRSRNQTPSPDPDELYVNRKDSQCSDVLLLSISGRTSRLSSIGSQGSAKSRLSNASHISIASGHSAYSQCSSPHKTILETSFCGYRSSDSYTAPAQEVKGDSEELEKVLLSRKTNLTEAILVEGLNSHSSGEVPSIELGVMNNNDLKKNYNKAQYDKPKLPKKIVSKSGVEYIYIPLKGPLPTDDDEEKSPRKRTQSAYDDQSHTNQNYKSRSTKDVKEKPPQIKLTESKTDKNEQPKYIRIKLKPDHCYNDDSEETPQSVVKPTCLNLTLNGDKPAPSKPLFDYHTTAVIEQKKTRSLTNTPSVSPKFIRRCSKGSSTPSPSVPRRNSFASMFRAGPDSPGSSKRKRKNTLTSIIKNTKTCSKCSPKSVDKNKAPFVSTSSSESVDSKGKATSVLSIFKTNSRERNKFKDSGSQELKNKIKIIDDIKPKRSSDRHRELPLNSESIRIPLHSPSYYTNRSLVEELNKSSEIEVVEASLQNENANKKSDFHEDHLDGINEINQEKQAMKSISINQHSECHLENNITVKEVEGIPKEKNIEDSKKSASIECEQGAEIIEESGNISITCEHQQNAISSLIPDEGNTYISDNIHVEIENHSNQNDDDRHSSESERDVELSYSKNNNVQHIKMDSLEIERKAIVLQQDSFEDELPYVPTTLPMERSTAVPILPVKQRCVMDVKTCPIERPRSTTPIHSTGLDNYIDGFMNKFEFKESKVTKPPEKLKISLPDTKNKQKYSSGGSAECTSVGEETPPPLPPKGMQKAWINFEEVPERRKPPKRIQTIPSRGHIDISGLVLKDHVVYTYVNPEECKCECHEHKEHENNIIKKSDQEEELPLLDVESNGGNSRR